MNDDIAILHHSFALWNHSFLVPPSLPVMRRSLWCPRRRPSGSSSTSLINASNQSGERAALRAPCNASSAAPETVRPCVKLKMAAPRCVFTGRILPFNPSQLLQIARPIEGKQLAQNEVTTCCSADLSSAPLRSALTPPPLVGPHLRGFGGHGARGFSQPVAVDKQDN